MTAPVEHVDRGPLSRTEMAQRVAADIPAGAYVNLGIGQPTTVADHLTPERGVVLHTENGMLGMGPAAHGDQIDPTSSTRARSPSPRHRAPPTSTMPTRSR
jgi:3-oxoadipate CoA-transferase beta subunit